MKTYSVTFIKYSDYEVEARSESEAIDKAYKLFSRDACTPIADTHYDEVDVEEIDEEVDEDE